MQESWPLQPVFRNPVAGNDLVGAGGRQVRWGSNQETDPLPRMLSPNRSPELHCFFGSLAHVQQYQIEKIRHPEQLCFGDALGRVHVNSAASQHTGAQLLHRFVAIDDEHVLRANLEGNRRLLGHRTPPSLLEAGVSESSVPFEKRASPERSKPRLFSRKGAGSAAPNRTRSLSVSGCYASSVFLQGRVRNLKVSNLRRTGDHFRQ